jgi:ABC-type branched-subunit amino acid transport system permease subunit
MKWLAYGSVGLCSGAFVGWGAYVSYVEPGVGDWGWPFWLDPLPAIVATIVGAAIGAAAAIAFGWAIGSRRR